MRACLLWALLVGPVAGAGAQTAEPLTLEQYARQLDAIRADLEAGRRDRARAGARALRERPITWGEETLSPDPSLLGGVTDAGSDIATVAARLRRLSAALDDPAPLVGPEPADSELLARLTPNDPLARGGDVPRLEVEPVGLPEQIGAAFAAAFDWVASLLRRIVDWLASLRPGRAEAPAVAPGSTAVVSLLFALAVVVALIGLVWRSRRSGAPAETDEPGSTDAAERDADPLSREATGWERRAAELAAARRYREAVRAWYHAVLVALFQAGRLHHQKGRTNWEYAARLGPEHAWRAAFVELTRLFDREWYGRPRSDAAALEECASQAREVLLAVRRGGRAA